VELAFKEHSNQAFGTGQDFCFSVFCRRLEPSEVPNMTPSEAKELSHLLARIGCHLDQSAAFVRDHDTPENFTAYRNVVGKLMGDLYLDAMVPLYRRFPELLPDDLNGPYKIPESVYLPTFYDAELDGSEA
jgi:hypothetical protein